MSEITTATHQPLRIRSTCDACLEAKVRCSRDRPSCRRCAGHGRECVYSFKRRLGRPRGTTKASQASNKNASRTAASTPSQGSPDPTFSSGLPFGPTSDNVYEGSNMSVDSMMMFDQNFNFSGDAGSHDALFPLWLSSIGGQDMMDPMTHDTAMHEPLPDAFPSSFPGSISDASSSFSPRQINSVPSLVDSSNSSTQDFNSSVPSPAAMDIPAFQQQNEYILPTVLARKLTSHPRDSPSSRQSPAAPPMDYKSMSPPVIAHPSPPRSNDIPLPARCGCYSNILQRLSELKDERGEFLSSRVDSIMKLEKDVRTQTLGMIACNVCISERPRALLLVGVVIESVVDLLESAVTFDGSLDALESRQTSLSSTSSAGRLASVGSTLLQLGEFEISGEEKLDFLRHLVNTRLHQLSNLIRQLHEHMQTCRTPNSNFKAAATIMAELSQRVHTLMNRLEG